MSEVTANAPPDADRRPVPDRICSLLPSATEIIAGLGLADRIVGVSAECDWPPAVRRLPVVTAARVDTAALASREIDDAVRAALSGGRSLYAVDEALLAELRPDVIVTQDLCQVCAVSSGEVRALRAVDAEVVSLDPHRIAEIEASVVDLAFALGVPERGPELVDHIQSPIEAVLAAMVDCERPPVAVVEWLDPPFAAGHWVPEMVAIAGGRDVLGRIGEPSFAVGWEDVRAAAPALVVVAACGFDAERAAREASAVPAGIAPRVVAVDANAYYSRPAPRIAHGIVQLAHLIHPDRVADPGLPAIELAPAPG
jgi:iron complex transport system substrate-binding protein